MTATKETGLSDAVAVRYAGDLLFDALLKAGRPVKVSEAARLVERSGFDLRLARVVLSLSLDRFMTSERRWTLAARSGDPQLPVERTIEEVLAASGRPLSEDALASQVSAIYQRPVEVYADVVRRLLAASDHFVKIGSHGFAHRSWLLEVSSDDPDDVLFDNFLSEEDIAPYEKAAKTIRAGDIDTIAAFLDKVDAPVPGRALQFLVWRADPNRFRAETLMAGMLDAGLTLLSSQQWLGPGSLGRLLELIPEIAGREIADEFDGRGAEPSQPLAVSDEERSQLIDYVMRNEKSSRASNMLEDIFEVSAGEPTYEADLTTVVECLRADERVVWVGTDRFLPVGAIPDYVYSVPENLKFNENIYYDIEGNVVDTLLEDDGLSGALKQDIMSPLAQDVLDEEPVAPIDGEPAVTVRCVLKFHHKEIGTFPLCQLPPGFFPSDAPIAQVGISLPSGQLVEAWVNNETRLVYGLLDWYNTVPIDTGAVFYIERKAWDHYVLTWGEETEPAMFVSRNRVNDLLELRATAEAEELPTFEVLRTIMEHYRKGIEFITALTEVGIVRRTHRRMVASLLSAYHCFYQRGNAWVFDIRRLSQGLDKSKRKYLVDR